MNKEEEKEESFKDLDDATEKIKGWARIYLKADKAKLLSLLDKATMREIKGEFREDIMRLLDEVALGLQANSAPSITEEVYKTTVLNSPGKLLLGIEAEQDLGGDNNDNIIQIPGITNERRRKLQDI